MCDEVRIQGYRYLLRAYNPEQDFDFILEAFANLPWQTLRARFGRVVKKCIVAEWLRSITTALVVMTLDNRFVGFCDLDPAVHNPSILGIAILVTPEFQRQGIGLFMALKAIEIAASDPSIKSCTLVVDSDNTGSIRLCESLIVLMSGICRRNIENQQWTYEIPLRKPNPIG